MTIRPTEATTVDRNNSTSTALAANETFTGRPVEVVRFASASVSVYTDVSNGIKQLYIEQSTDAVNWDLVEQKRIPAKTPCTFPVSLGYQFLRVRFVNGPKAQGEFRLQTVFNLTRDSFLGHKNPDAYIPVRLTDGTDFDAGESLTALKAIQCATDNLLIQQKLTNKYLAHIAGFEIEED